MRTTIIPAQITTVEDKIAGSLNMTQILICMIPVLFTVIIYTLLHPTMKLAPYKLALVALSTILSLPLAIRIKGKIVAEWLTVFAVYRLRPKFFVFNKNDVGTRTIDIPEIPSVRQITKKKISQLTRPEDNKVEYKDLVKLESLIRSGKVALHYQFSERNS